MRNVVRNVALVVGGLAVGLAAVEVLFRVRDHGAFPHLNVYVADPTLAVRLRPGAVERVSFSGNPVTEVRINAEGYRGADWPAHADAEIFVVGDSQAFGLGVEEPQRFASQLGADLHRPVANAAVPTYGPDEYEAVLREELPRRRPKTVLYVVNIANDLFEASHSNVTRHAVWDGWAVRKETAPPNITPFPGRELLYRDSHAFFALRRALHDGANDAGAVPSEGGWQDIARAGSEARATHEREAAQSGTVRTEKQNRLKSLLEERAATDAVLEKVVQEGFSDEAGDYGSGTLHAAKAQPGDILRIDFGEGSGAVVGIAQEIERAAKVRHRFEQALAAKHDTASIDAIAKADVLDKELRILRATPLEIVRARSPLRAHLERAASLCKENGAELVVVVLPLDVQVSKDEWVKYHAPPIDLSASRALVDDVLAVASELGARTVDAWPALAKAEPGAFLDGDLHMTPKGHRAVADAIVTALARPARTPLPPLPVGRSAVPTPGEWTTKAARNPGKSLESELTELRPYHCTASVVREWTRIGCTAGRWDVTTEGHSEAMVTNGDTSTLVFATLEDDAWLFHLVSPKGRSIAVIGEWAIGDASAYVRDATDHNRPYPELTPGEVALAACGQGEGDPAPYGAPQPGCDAYACKERLACVRGDDSAPPVCAPSQRVVGITHRCGR